MIISCIVAKTRNNVIGRNNNMPWHISDDLKNFKNITTGHTIVMGRKNHESIGRPLPGRTNIIITKNPCYSCCGCIVVNSIEKAIECAKQRGETELFIIGGGQIYEQTKHLWDKMYITEIDAELDGDVFFPDIDISQWKLTAEKCIKKSEKNEYDFCFKIYEKRS